MSKLNIDLIPATREQIPVMHQLACLYRYDLSEFTDWPVPKDGHYVYHHLEDYWEDGYTPLLLKVNAELAGFVILENRKADDEIDFEFVEFFILRKFRGRGVGKYVAIRLFNMYSGRWLIKQLIANEPAIAFWRKLLSEYTAESFEEYTEQDSEFGLVHVMQFCNK